METRRQDIIFFFEDSITGWTDPRLESEEDDPAEADAKYESAVRWLREQEFETKRFRLIFKENKNICELQYAVLQ
ncbi:hypothetical protein MNBD_NITROSPIRAE01-1324 [hydrothermal vent metagenome]|uniref:Uncharacterized protein n=1 Tax=hydrothermal vent metagenome TaxID=652676 RepID=A0A3B1D0E3_9ZZZZ